ncbi:MAG TPA: YciI family protein [Candidatus Limnocylindrales bacterium]|jgi:hypothetical protein
MTEPPPEHAMRYLILIYEQNSANPPAEPPPADVVEATSKAYNAYTQMLKDRGAFLGGDALQPVTTATTVRIRDGQTMTTDGPFAETKEALGGFYMIEAADLDDALALAAACPAAEYGSVEVRPIWEYA